MPRAKVFRSQPSTGQVVFMASLSHSVLTIVTTDTHTDGMTPRKPMVRMTVRVPAKLRDAAMAKADENDEYLSEVIRAALQSYVKNRGTS